VVDLSVGKEEVKWEGAVCVGGVEENVETWRGADLDVYFLSYFWGKV
jgi:hypothetical protein